MRDNTVFQIKCGRLLCGHLREMLDSEIFLGSNIMYLEGKGLFSRTFTIRGKLADVNRVYTRVDQWLKNLGE